MRFWLSSSSASPSCARARAARASRPAASSTATPVSYTHLFYHIAADDAQWAQLKQLVDRVYELVQQANREGYLQDGEGKAQR